MNDEWKPVVGDLNAEIRSRFAEGVDAENREGPSMTPDPIPPNVDPVQWLIDRVQGVIVESVQMGTEPLSTKAGVLAQLYQVQALRDIAEQLHEISGSLESLESSLFSRRNPTKRWRRRTHPRAFADIFRDLADAAEDLNDR